MVKVDYIDVNPPIIDIDDAIQKKSIIPNPGIKDLVVGDADRKFVNAIAKFYHFKCS